MKYTKAMRQADFFRRMSDLGFTYAEAQRLRRCQMTLHRWAEAECNGEIERRESDNRPERVSPAYISGHLSTRTAWLIPDRESGALRQIKAIMSAHPELWFYHQTDPRGCALYVGSWQRRACAHRKPFAVERGGSLDSLYTQGLAVCC